MCGSAQRLKYQKTSSEVKVQLKLYHAPNTQTTAKHSLKNISPATAYYLKPSFFRSKTDQHKKNRSVLAH
jgi:hypothetical protein